VRRCAAIAGLCLFASIATSRAQAQAALPLELQWQAPAECPGAGDVRGELERIARVRPGFSLTPLRARATVERRGGGYATTLYTEHEGQAGERALQGADCAALARAVTLVLALAFGAGVEVADTTAPEAAAATAGEPATPAPTPAAVTPELAQPEASDEVSEERSRTTPAHALRWSALAGGGVQLGVFPSVAFSASAGAEVAFASFAIGLRATAWPGVTDAVVPHIDARFDGVGGVLQGCGRLPWSSLVLAACAEARAAALRGRSSGASDDGASVAPWYALGAAASITWPESGAFAVRLQAALAASLNRPRFVITDLQQAHRVPLLAPDFAAFAVFTP
jgi:hypothetical protein